MTVGGLPGIRHEDSILSAIGRPYHGYHRRIFEKAAALTEGLIKNHGFVDGNKRTTLLAVHLVLWRSGYGLAHPQHADENDDFEHMLVQVADSAMTYDEIVDWFKTRIVKR